jgi:hypothetical protein
LAPLDLAVHREIVFQQKETRMQRTCWSIALGSLCILEIAAQATAQDKPTKIEFADGKFTLEAPATWQRKQPRTRIVEHEFEVPVAKGDENAGRVTLMGAGGGVEANIQRWFGQFTQPDGANTSDKAKVKKTSLAGQDVHLIDVSGTYLDRPGPAAPGVERPGYRMLAAVIATKDLGTYFIKFYGPERTVADNEKAFLKMIEGLSQK